MLTCIPFQFTWKWVIVLLNELLFNRYLWLSETFKTFLYEFYFDSKTEITKKWKPELNRIFEVFIFSKKNLAISIYALMSNTELNCIVIFILGLFDHILIPGVISNLRQIQKCSLPIQLMHNSNKFKLNPALNMAT